jgi:hypothetical protein
LILKASQAFQASTGNSQEHDCNISRYKVLVTLIALTGQALSASCAIVILSSSKLPVDFPLLIPPLTFDLPSSSPSKWSESSV